MINIAISKKKYRLPTKNNANDAINLPAGPYFPIPNIATNIKIIPYKSIKYAGFLLLLLLLLLRFAIMTTPTL